MLKDRNWGADFKINLNSSEKLIDKMIKEKDFDSYAVLVSKDGQERSLMSDNVNKDTYFDIASMGKVLVTSTLILNAVGNGSLSLDDTLDKFFAVFLMCIPSATLSNEILEFLLRPTEKCKRHIYKQILF